MWDPWVKLVTLYEGFARAPYRCPGGVWTIGYGHTGPDVTAATKPITSVEALVFLKQDMQEAEEQALELSPNLARASDARRSAIADFCYNCGPVAYRNSTLRKRVEAENWPGAAEQNGRWVFSKGKKLAGLVRRRAVTSKWLREG